LQVRAFDKDLLFHDKLGVAITDATGSFRIEYSQLDFSSIFGTETVPELFIRIFDAAARSCCHVAEAIRNNPQVKSATTSRFRRRHWIVQRLGPDGDQPAGRRIDHADSATLRAATSGQVSREPRAEPHTIRPHDHRHSN
jgi:hypothetical protein